MKKNLEDYEMKKELQRKGRDFEEEKEKKIRSNCKQEKVKYMQYIFRRKLMWLSYGYCREYIL
jgi:hypothetical protein